MRPRRQRLRRRSDHARPVPLRFSALTIAVVLAAAAAVAVLSLTGGWGGAGTDSTFYVLVALVVVGDLLPIQVPRKYSYDRLTMSTAFALALLLAYGAVPAIAAYVAASLIADRLDPTAPVKAAFNAAQYALALVGAALVLRLAGPLPVDSMAGELGVIVGAGATLFLLNHVLAGVGAAWVTFAPVSAYLRRDLGFHAWTGGAQLALAPVLVLAAGESLALMLLACLPLLAIFLGGRQAAINQYRASHDLLTGLPNRWMLQSRLDETLRRAGDGHEEVVLLMIDLDDFKAVNDTLGHHNGDLLLEAVASRMGGALRRGDVLARMGGDEFAVLAAQPTDRSGAQELAERLLRSLDEPFALEHLLLTVGASIGIAVANQGEDDDDAADLMRRADVALYRAKGSRSAYAVYDDRALVRDADRLEIASDLRGAIERGELFLEYQPKLSLKGRAHEAEALVRWRHPERGILPPDAFVPVAEHTGLIKSLTVHVLDMAVRQCADWRTEGLSARVSVNLSPRNLLDKELPRLVQRTLERHGLPPALLQLEVTESRTFADMPRARIIINELRRCGIGVSIDDFGTGFCSLSQVRQLHVDELKIDKSFVLDMERSAPAEAVVRCTIELARSLGIAVTAEGVETAESWRQLAELGCDSLQGYAVGRPVPAEECQRRLRRLSQAAEACEPEPVPA